MLLAWLEDGGDLRQTFSLNVFLQEQLNAHSNSLSSMPSQVGC